MVAWKVAPALAAGNCCVVKPSELASLTTLELGAIAAEAGLPPGVLNIVTGTGADAGAPLRRARVPCAVQGACSAQGQAGSPRNRRETRKHPVAPTMPPIFAASAPADFIGNPGCSAHPKVAKIAFTGSVGTGRRVYAAAASNLRPATMELGGKSGEQALAGSAGAAWRAWHKLRCGCALHAPFTSHHLFFPPHTPSYTLLALLPAALIVFEDADVDKAVEWAMFGVFWTCGQVGCASLHAI